jgi:hypothetical protein
VRTTLVPIDSEILNGNVIAIDEFSLAEDFAEFEKQYVEAYRPVYASCKIPLECVSEIHVLERCGFNLIECQIRSRIELKALFDTSPYPYKFERVTTEDVLESVLEIAGTTFDHDRFSVDPRVERNVSGQRYRRYVQHSFALHNEAVYRLYDPASDKTVAFKTHRYLDNGNVLFLLGGVHPQHKGLGLGVINSYSEFNELFQKGFSRGYTHISAANYHVFNVEIGKLGFRVITTYAVMRKIYFL